VACPLQYNSVGREALMRIPVHIIKEKRRRDEARRRRESGIPIDSPKAPDEQKGYKDRPKEEKKRSTIISIKF
jgi:hypothetical protein